jgi:large subunit ribosomal protein L22
MEAVAKLRKCPMSPRKMRYVVDNIRGMEVGQALSILKYTKKESASWLDKLLRSAIANWEQKHNASAEEHELVIKTIFVDGGTFLKRFQPAPQGRAYRIRKRTNHVTLIVGSESEVSAEIQNN